VTRGGNHIFGHVVGADGNRLPTVKTEALAEALGVHSADILSPVYVGWTQGYLDDGRRKFEAWAAEQGRIRISHPRQAYQALIAELQNNSAWLN
ncbi:MAG: type I-B CRISPR-associated protein Cas7/Cst2/DevR, partial [Candidatus Promineifilaceae bacterium]